MDEVNRHKGSFDPTVDAAVEQAAEDDMDLRESLAALSQLTLGPKNLADMLAYIAEFAARAIPGADGAGLTLMQDDRPTVSASAEFVRQVDDLQYSIGEGPCITAAQQGCTVSSGSLGGERQWPRFGPRAGRMGVHSVVSLPLLGHDGVVGALNVYAHSKDAFDDRAIRLGELFAIPAGLSAQTAGELDRSRRLVAQLTAAMRSREVIDYAVGVVMSRSGCTPSQAFDRLRTISQTEHRRVAAVAQQLIDDAVRRARARRAAD